MTPDQPLPPDLDPKQIGDRVLAQQVDQMTQRGELKFTSWAQNSRPADGWNLSAFQGLMKNNTPSVPAFAGAQLNMPWMDQAKADIGGAEGNEAYAYHGSTSDERVKQKKFRVSEGDNLTGHEISVGYGFNLTQNGGRQLYEAALGGKDAPAYDDVLSGKKPISPQNASALQEYMILQKNAMLDRMAEGTPLRDHQRAALVSMLYQGVSPKPVLDALRAGKTDEEAAEILRRSGPPGFATRRNFEASRFLGSKAQAFFDNSTNKIPGRTDPQIAAAGEINPTDRH